MTPLVTLQGTDTVINGIDAGYPAGDMAVIANQWNGNPNNGEFGVTGTQIGDTGPPSVVVSGDDVVG